MSLRFVLIALLFLSVAYRGHAQEADAYKFQPPPPPPLSDTPDFDELDDDGFEADDEGFRPPPPPPLPPIPGGVSNEPISPSQTRPGTPPPPPPVPDFRTNNAAYISTPGKFRFRVVEGEYWEKGKKRSRGRQMLGRSSN